MPPRVKALLTKQNKLRKHALFEFEEVPYVPPVQFNVKHGLLLLEGCGIPEFSEEYWSMWTNKPLTIRMRQVPG